MAIELRNPLTITEETKIYGHNTVDIDGVPTDAGNGNVGQIVDIVDTKYIQGIKTDIDNIKAKINGEIYRTQLVEANAYQIDVPSPVFPYAEVQKLKGKSVVWNQIFKNTNTSSNGLTFTNSEDGTITINGTPTSSYSNFSPMNSAQKATAKIYVVLTVISNPDGIKMQFGFLNRNLACEIINSGKSYTIFNQTSDMVSNGTSQGISFNNYSNGFNNVKIKILNINLTQMFGSGNEPSLEECKKIFSEDYYPYDEGTIKSFPVKTVKSVGKNLLNPSKLRDGDYDEKNKGIRVSVDVGNRVYVNKGTKVSLSFTETTVVKRIWLIITDSSNNALENLFVNSTENATATTMNDGYLTPIFGGTLASDGTWGSITVNDVIKANPQLEIGEITPYKSYMESTIDLSSVTTDMKSAGSVADEWQNGKVTKRIGSYVIDGVNIKMEYLYTSNDYGNVFYMASNLHTRLVNAISDKFKKTSEPISKMPLYSFMGGSGSNNTIWFVLPSTITTLEQANEWFKNNPTTVYYELDTPTEETVPLTEQFIDVESKGTLTFISDESVQMPIESTTKFVVNLEEV